MLFGALGLSSASAVLLGLRHISVAVRQVYILEPIALASAILLTYFNHTRSRVSSTTLLLFWPAYTIALGLWLRTALSLHPFADIRILVSLKAATLACGLLSCVLECWRPEFDVPPKIDEVTGHQEHPLTTANVYSKLVRQRSVTWRAGHSGFLYFFSFYTIPHRIPSSLMHCTLALPALPTPEGQLGRGCE